MGTFLNYAIPGIPQGCEYGLMAVGLVLTFRATGVFNLAFAAQAFVSAFAYDLLNQYQGWPQWAAFIVAVLIISPAIGLALDRFLYRHIPTASTTAKVLSSLGVLIAVPLLIPIIFGNTTRTNIAWVWLNPQTVYFTLYKTPLDGTTIATTVITVVVVAGLMALVPLEQHRPADAGRGREPAPGPTRRGELRRGGRHRLGTVERPGRAGRRPHAPAVASSSTPPR